ncbi:hypothetical protein SAMN05444266_106166 [Chitinophaga jiangningensis]|uniref:Uncharacterized protein n=1 Tax=Chitinophaga jiangningensis TaxID=1419482 RepID=A0A1M7FJP6_9BACT|nr:hypothetical protein [Chitinophaga jiangningensis]SHM04185.1 hypothetical protein SAMN05444266_106166 [Chitinophaga jiangningensis]
MTNKPNRRKTRANTLATLHKVYTQQSVEFREQVCKECKWSVPTFYRKMRLKDVLDDDTDTYIPSLSNAEKEKIEAIFAEVYKKSWNRAVRSTKNKASLNK